MALTTPVAWELRPVQLSDRDTFAPYLTGLSQPLSDYTFAQVYGWRTALNLWWRIIDGHLCVFANGSNLSLLMPPLAPTGTSGMQRALRRACEIMDDYNAELAAQERSGRLVAPRIESISDELMERMPGFGISLFTVMIPVLLMLLASAADAFVPADAAGPVRAALHFVGHPIVALLLALLFSFWSLGRARRFTREQILKFCNDCLGPTATILLVIGAGGGFNAVLVQSGGGRVIADVATGSHVSPLLLAWIVAALIRVATGSATVAMTTAAGIVAPLAATIPGTSAELLVLVTGAGSLVLSHVNDAGFWLIKEFFNMTVPQTLRTWTAAETIIGVAGLIFTMLLALVL